MWHYHATSRRHCRFKQITPIEMGELCPKCRRPFAIVWKYICKGCNTTFYSDASYKIGDEFDCPIYGEPVRLVEEQVSVSAKPGKASRGFARSATYTLATITSLCVVLQAFSTISLVIPVLLSIVTLLGFFLLIIASFLITLSFLNIITRTNESQAQEYDSAEIGHTFEDHEGNRIGTDTMNVQPKGYKTSLTKEDDRSRQHSDILDQNVNPNDPNESTHYITNSRRIILTHRITIFILLNIITIIGFTCYTPTITPTVTVVETRIIGIKAIQIGGTSAIVFGVLFYTGKFTFELDKRLREKSKITRTLILGTMFGIATVFVLAVGSYLGDNYIDGSDAFAVAIAMNIITDTCIFYQETLIRYYLERLKPIITNSLPNSSSRSNIHQFGQVSSEKPEGNFFSLIIIIILAIICFSAIIATTGYLTSPFSHEIPVQLIPTLGPRIKP